MKVSASHRQQRTVDEALAPASRSAQSAFCSLAKSRPVAGIKRAREAGDQELDISIGRRHCEGPHCMRGFKRQSMMRYSWKARG